MRSRHVSSTVPPTDGSFTSNVNAAVHRLPRQSENADITTFDVSYLPPPPPHQADGVTTSDAGKESWSASSDRSELGISRGGSVTMAAASGAGADGGEKGALKAEGGTSDAEGASEGGRGRGRGPRKGEAGWKRRRKMLLVSGMMGVKRHCLSTLRYGER